MTMHIDAEPREILIRIEVVTTSLNLERLRSQHSTKGDSTIFKVSILLDFAFDNLFEVSWSMSLQLSLWEEALMVLFIHKLWDFAQVFVFLVFG